MKNNEEFKNEVYERFEKYKAKKAKTRRDIIKYGSMTLSALVVAVAVASPAFRSVFSKSQSAPTMEDKNSSLYNVEAYNNKSAGGAEIGGDAYGETEAENNVTPTYARFDFGTKYGSGEASVNTTVDSPTQAAATTAAGTYATTVATQGTQNATVSEMEAATTAAATVSTTPAVSGTTSVITTEETNEKYDPSPDVSVVGANNFGEYFVGIKFFSETGEAVAAEDAELSAGSGVKRYKYQTDDYDGSTPRVCFGVTVYGALIINTVEDDGETLTYHFRLFEYEPDPLRYINIFTVAGDRKIVLSFSELPTDKGGNE